MTDNNQQNWSQIRETVLLINVAVARIEHAMTEGDDSFTSLSQSFVEIVDSARQITNSAEELDNSPVKSAINDSCQDISQRIDNSIVAFQFYDKLSQRMTLVSKTLNSLTEILKDPNKTNVQDEWIKLQNVIRSKYTLDTDQKMFDDVLNGIPLKEALAAAVETTTEDDIEFF